MKTIYVIPLFCAALLGCLDSSKESATSSSTSSDSSFKMVSSLSNDNVCNSGKQGTIVFDNSQSQFFACNNGQWMAINPVGLKGEKGDPGINGASVARGYSSLISMASEPAGSNCAAGGQKVMTGIDNGNSGGIADNGILETGEITQTSYLCMPSGGSLPRMVIKSGNTVLAYLINQVGGNEGFFALPSGHIFRLDLTTGQITREMAVYAATGCGGQAYFDDNLVNVSNNPYNGQFLTLKRVVNHGGVLSEVGSINNAPLNWQSIDSPSYGCRNGVNISQANHSGVLVPFSGTIPDFTALAPIQLVLQ